MSIEALLTVPTKWEARFWSKIDVKDEDECWQWLGSSWGQSYGGFSIKGRKYRAHRVMWELIFGPIPQFLDVCHSCDNRLCVNSAHLWLGSHAENMHDSWLKEGYVQRNMEGMNRHFSSPKHQEKKCGHWGHAWRGGSRRCEVGCSCGRHR